MSRRSARETVMRLLFEREFHLDLEDAFDVMQPLELSKQDWAYIEDVRDGVLANLRQIDEILEKYSIGWKLERMARVDKSILRLAVYEIAHTNVPDSVAIKEAVSLAQTFSTQEAASFINGILGSFVRGLETRQEEEKNRMPQQKEPAETAETN